VGAEKTVQPFAQEAHTENHQRDAAENRDATHFAGILRKKPRETEKEKMKVCEVMVAECHGFAAP